MSSRSVRTPGGSRRNYTVAKFRERVPQLSNSSSRVRMGVKKGELGEQQWALEVGGSTYDGTKERIGGTLGVAATSSYALFRMDPTTGVLTLLPQGQEKKSGGQKTHEVEWYDFRPALTHATISMDDAMRAMDRQDHSGSRVKGRELKARNQGGEDEEGQALEERALDEPDEFDDGHDAKFRENLDEDGREGLDMENEDDIFDDDDDDFFAEDDEEAVESRLQAKQFGAGSSTLAGVEANEEEREDDEGEEGAEGSEEWKKTSKEVLKAERRQRAKDEDDDDFDDDDDDDDEGEAALKALLNEPGPAQAEAHEGAASGEGKEGKKDEVKLEGAVASAAQGKRKPSPGPDEPQAKRSRPDAPRKGRVTEKEVVGVLAEHGRMRLRDLIAPFKPHIRNKEDKDEFMKMVKLIGKLIKESGESYVVLNDAAKHKYGIKD